MILDLLFHSNKQSFRSWSITLYKLHNFQYLLKAPLQVLYDLSILTNCGRLSLSISNSLQNQCLLSLSNRFITYIKHILKVIIVKISRFKEKAKNSIDSTALWLFSYTLSTYLRAFREQIFESIRHQHLLLQQQGFVWLYEYLPILYLRCLGQALLRTVYIYNSSSVSTYQTCGRHLAISLVVNLLTSMSSAMTR